MAHPKSGIYLLVNQATGKSYVGSAVNLTLRLRGHFNALRRGTHRNKHLQASFNKYGDLAFAVAILELVSDPSLLIEREQVYIDLLNSAGRNGYNQSPTAGSTLGINRPPFSEEWRSKLSNATKGEKNPFYGRKHSEEARQQIAAKARVRMADPTKNYFYDRSLIGELNGMYGKTHSVEARAKIGAASQGRKWSPELRMQMSRYRKGRTLLKNRKAVIQIKDGTEIARFTGVQEAALSVGRSIQSLSMCLHGNTHSCAGYKWEFVA
jgi:group I intron endonuclease